jgi:large subunit ribosomal protein L7/L12
MHNSYQLPVMPTLDDRIAKHEQKLKQLKAQQQQIEARKRAALTKKRRADGTRRKILVGAAILNAIERGKMTNSEFLALMNDFLTRDDDRALFDLSSITSKIQ